MGEKYRQIILTRVIFSLPLIVGILIIFFLSSCSKEKRLAFDSKGEFKILQFTDMHLSGKHADTVIIRSEKIIDMEKPNLIIFSGDIFCETSDESLIEKLGQMLEKKKTPWVFLAGNHDDEWGITREKLVNKIRKLPYNINRHQPKISGETNFVLKITDESKKIKALIYCFDSHSYNLFPQQIKGKYGWIDFSQIQWYRCCSEYYTRQNDNKPLPALAFFHIPLPEFHEKWQNDSMHCTGSRKEAVCSPTVNSGLFTACAEKNDVMGIFTGHDHVNDFIGMHQGIALGYGRFSGGSNAYGGMKPGARVIVLEKGKKLFKTWIREWDGNTVLPYYFPNKKYE